MAHVKQSRPESGLCFQVKVCGPFRVVPFSLGNGTSLSWSEVESESKRESASERESE